MATDAGMLAEGEPDPALLNPASSISARQRLEVTIEDAIEPEVAAFLREVAGTAKRDGYALGAATVHGIWAVHEKAALSRALGRAAERGFVGDAFERELTEALQTERWAEDALSTVQTLHMQSATHSWSTGMLHESIDAALSMDMPRVQTLTAAGGWGALPQAILDLWEDLQGRGQRWRDRVKRVARTSSTGLWGWSVEQRLRVTQVPLKRWVTRHDDKVRTTHIEADGQTVPVLQRFRVGSTTMMYPGDPSGEYGERVNCRCVMIGLMSEPGSSRARDGSYEPR